MSETPKFEVIDRRKIKAEEEQGSAQAEAQPVQAAPVQSEPGAGPRLVVNEREEPRSAGRPGSGTGDASSAHRAGEP